jgi:DNA-binding response OmpR family regulator
MIGSFGSEDLVARVQSLIKRSPERPKSVRVEVPDLVINHAAMTISVRGTEIVTTGLEFRLIEYLARHRGRVFTRDLLLDAVWGETQFVTPRSVDACIRRIRYKIELHPSSPTYLKTIRGIGYRLDALAVSQAGSEGGCECVVCRTPAERPNILMKRSRSGEKGMSLGVV